MVLEAGFMIAGHYRPLLDSHFGLFAMMSIAGTAALLYARALARGYVKGALGGLVIGSGIGTATPMRRVGRCDVIRCQAPCAARKPTAS